MGCTLSPALFALFLSDLEDYLDGGIVVNGRSFKLLAHAVLLTSDKLTMRKIIEVLRLYCRKLNLKINLAKSKIVVFRNRGK